MVHLHESTRLLWYFTFSIYRISKRNVKLKSYEIYGNSTFSFTFNGTNFLFKNGRAREKRRVLFKTLKLFLSCSHNTFWCLTIVFAWKYFYTSMLCLMAAVSTQQPSMVVGSGFSLFLYFALLFMNWFSLSDICSSWLHFKFGMHQICGVHCALYIE